VFAGISHYSLSALFSSSVLLVLEL